MKTNVHLLSRSTLLRMINISDKMCGVKLNTLHVRHLFPENRSLYQIVWKKCGRLQLKCDGTHDAREGKWRGNWRMEWVASTLHTTSEHDVSSTTTADAHTSDAGCRLNWSPRLIKWTRPFRRKTKSGFCACDITFQMQCTTRQPTDGNIKRRMRSAWWKTRTTNTHSDYVMDTVNAMQQRLRERASMLL